jgi:hypothetical protein
MPEDFDENNVSKRDFIDKILSDCFTLDEKMSRIKMEFLADTFQDIKYDNYVEIDNFLGSLL